MCRRISWSAVLQNVPLVLRDGSLPKVAPIPGHETTAAFFSLAPTANIWQQASAALAAPLAPCQYVPTVRPQPECADPLSLNVIASGSAGNCG